MNSSLRRWLHFIGGALGLVGVIFVVVRVSTYSEQIDFVRFESPVWFLLAVFALIYGAANILLSMAWWNLLAYFDIQVGRKWALKTYCVSQLAKYVPGNIFHLAGRQALGMAIGLPGRELAKSTLWELILIAFAGSFYGLLALPLVWPDISVPFSAVAFGILTVGSVILLGRLLTPSVGVALIWQFSFLTLSGFLFVGVVAIVSPGIVTFPFCLTLCGAYTLAWLAGLITPGAPAGVGVRELVLLFLLKGVVGEADLLLAVLLGRMVTVGGDVLIYSIAMTLNVGPLDSVTAHD